MKSRRIGTVSNATRDHLLPGVGQRRWSVLLLVALAATMAATWNGALASTPTQQGPLEDLGPALERGEPIDLAFAEAVSSHQVYRALERAFGVEIALDRHLPDVPVVFERKQATLPAALEALNQKLDAFFVVRGPRAVTVAPDTPPNRRRYEPHYVARFRIRDVDPATAMNSLRALVDVRKIALDEAGPTLILRGSRATVQQAARMLEELDQPRDMIEMQVEAFAVDTLDRLSELDSMLATDEARAALREVGASPVLQQRSTIAAGVQGRLEAASQPYVGKELGWEGLVVEHRFRAGDERSVILDARVLGACVSPTSHASLRRDRREQTVQSRIRPGQSVLLLEPVPPADPPVGDHGNTCGLLPEEASKRTQFVLLITPTLRAATHRPLDAEAWLAGTESHLDTTGTTTQQDTSR